MTSNRSDNAPERLGDRPGFDEWAAEVVTALETRRTTTTAVAATPRRRRSRIGRAWRFVARTVRLA